MAWLDTPRTHLHFHLEGSRNPHAPLMVMLHAVGLCGSWWSDYSRQYRGGWRIAAPDLPGHGLSSSLDEDAEMSDIADDVAGLIDHLGGAAHVIGVSMGGMVAQELAIRHPAKVASLVLLSTLSTLPDAARPAMLARGALAVTSGMEAAAHETALRWTLDGVESLEFRARCFQQLCDNDPSNWATSWRAISRIDTWSRLSQVRCPVLVATGDRDASTTPEQARAIAERVGDGHFTPLPGAGHMAAFSRPAVVRATMDRFYAQVAATHDA